MIGFVDGKADKKKEKKNMRSDPLHKGDKKPHPCLIFFIFGKLASKTSAVILAPSRPISAVT